MESRPASFTLRALTAIGLLVAFYVLAIGLALGLAWLPIFFWNLAARLPFQIVLACWLAAATIGWSILPRIDRFDPPYPRLTAEAQPRLFAVLEDLARRTGQAMPAEVYLLPDLNAWVAQRGGIMGIGSRRVMGLGLPLMQTFSQAEFEATVAHEFGHFHAGDTRLGPWVYKTRAAIERTLENLKDSVVRLPFQLYVGLFLRSTLAMSRQQEYSADRLAATTVGAEPLISGLRKLPGLAPAYAAYWQHDFGPAIEGGTRPPLLEGFQRFLSNGDVQQAIERQIEAELNSGETNPLDSHPSVPDRIRALASPAPGPAQGAGKDPHAVDPAAPALIDVVPAPASIDDVSALALRGEAPALALLDDVPALECALIDSIVRVPRASAGLEPLDWDDIGPRRILPSWQVLARREAAALAGITPLDLPAVLAEARPFAARIEGVAQPVPASVAPDLVAQVLAMALGAALAKNGWQVDATPEVGAVTLRRGEAAIEPFRVLHQLRQGELESAAWAERCAAVGIADLDLGRVDAAAAEDPAIAAAGSSEAAVGAVGSSEAALAPPLAEPWRFRPLRWAAALVTAGLVYALFDWIETPTGTVGALTAVQLGTPVWTLLPAALALAFLPFVIRRESGVFAGMLYIGFAMFVFFAVGMAFLDTAAAGNGMWLTALLSLGYCFVGILGFAVEGTPLSSPLARLALLGRHNHLRAVRELGQQPGWDYIEAGPGRPAHEARGIHRGRRCTVSSGFAFSMADSFGGGFSDWSGYVLRIAIASPFAAYTILGGRMAPSPPPEVAAIARVKTFHPSHGALRFHIWRRDGGPIDDAVWEAIDARLEAGTDFFEHTPTAIMPTGEGLLYIRASKFRLADDALFMRQIIDWMYEVVRLLEGDIAP